MQKFIEETNDIDIAFVGSSHLLFGIDTPYVQQKLREQIGDQAVVRSICFRWCGFDFLYFVSKDLLARRHIKTLVFDDECSLPLPEGFHTLAPQWFRFENNGDLSGLPLRNQGAYYYAAMLGMPRHVLALVSPNLPNDPDLWLRGEFGYFHAANPESRLGSLAAHLVFNPASSVSGSNFVSFVPPMGTKPAGVCIFSAATASNFVFGRRALPANQIYFAKKLAALAQSHGCRLVELHLPMNFLSERNSPVMTESRDWFKVMQMGGCLMGIPNARLFAGLSAEEISRLYYDMDHLNENGQRYFTSVITPALLQIHESHVIH
jgi:hypothetical protein